MNKYYDFNYISESDYDDDSYNQIAEVSPTTDIASICECIADRYALEGFALVETFQEKQELIDKLTSTGYRIDVRNCDVGQLNRKNMFAIAWQEPGIAECEWYWTELAFDAVSVWNYEIIDINVYDGKGVLEFSKKAVLVEDVGMNDIFDDLMSVIGIHSTPLGEYENIDDALKKTLSKRKNRYKKEWEDLNKKLDEQHKKWVEKWGDTDND